MFFEQVFESASSSLSKISKIFSSLSMVAARSRPNTQTITLFIHGLMLSPSVLPTGLCLVFLLSAIPLSLSLSVSNSIVASRLEFLSSTTSIVVTSLGGYYSDNKDASSSVVVLPLKFLPKAGCLAVRINVNDKKGMQRLFSYFAVIDTGSPFCTAPPAILPFSKDESHQYPPTLEQYGETVGKMNWRSIANVQLLTNSYVKPLDISGKVIVGIPDDNVVDDTGGMFLGLMLHDKYRPTVLSQWGYSSFVLDYRNQSLKLVGGKKNKISLLFNKNDPNVMELFDFFPFGDNVHHYGVQCTCFSLHFSNKEEESISISSLSRPIVAVIDSGLTGCVFSDSLRDELMERTIVNNKHYVYNVNNTQQFLDQQFSITGMTITLPTISGKSFLTLSSNPNYWSLSTFKLPWFYNNDNHPHVIAMGATFLARTTRISVDPLARRIKIEV